MKRNAARGSGGAKEARILVASDVHGRLGLLFRIAAEYERESGRPLDAILVTGDLGVFPDDSRLDTSTQKKSRETPDELGFRALGARAPVTVVPQSPALTRHLDGVRSVLRACGPRPRGKIYFIGGNHEDFAYLEQCRALDGGDAPYAVDAAGRVLWIPTGTTLELSTAAGTVVVACVSGISLEESGRDPARYHPLALLEESAARAVSASGPCDLLLTHDSARDFVLPGRGAAVIDELVATLRPTLHLSGHYHAHVAPRVYGKWDAARYPAVATLGVHIDTLVPPEGGVVSSNAVGIVAVTAEGAGDARPFCSFAFAPPRFLARFSARSGYVA